jgi:hypothetical protein
MKDSTTTSIPIVGSVAIGMLTEDYTPLFEQTARIGGTAASIPIVGNAAISPKEGSTTAPVPATGSAAVSVLLKDYRPRSEQTTPALESNTKRRRLYGRGRRAFKRELRIAFSDTDAETFERPEGTSCIAYGDTFERPDGTSCLSRNSHLNESVNDVRLVL